MKTFGKRFSGIALTGSSLFLLWNLVFLFAAQDAQALAQWARKYGVKCSTCHTVFPRLNFFGEKFMRNAYQWPGEAPDGDKTGKEELSEDLFIDKVSHWFGARIQITPFEYKTNSVTQNGKTQDSFNVGKTKELNFFVGGTLFKNMGLFIEQTFTDDASEIEWFNLKYANIFNTTLVNFQVGRLSPVDFTPYADRLRIFQKSDILNVKSSNGLGENSVNIRSPRPGVQYYGYKGPFLWYAGLDNGKDASDTDRKKNFWAGARAYLPKIGGDRFEGSSVAFHYYDGTDTASSVASQIENDFRRYTISGNLRFNTQKSERNFDLLFAYQFAQDENFDLNPTSSIQKEFQGLTVTGAYLRDNWFYVLQYDQITSDDILALGLNKISPSIWYLARNNFKVGLTGRVDVSGAIQTKSEFKMEIRSMF
ncbi:MAG: hypothetical protein ACE5G9_05590 [Nitrospinales bacterium]